MPAGISDFVDGAPILAYPDFTRDFLLETDASGTGLGAALAEDKTIIRFNQ